MNCISTATVVAPKHRLRLRGLGLHLKTFLAIAASIGALAACGGGGSDTADTGVAAEASTTSDGRVVRASGGGGGGGVVR
jgi:hypothetical protein